MKKNLFFLSMAFLSMLMVGCETPNPDQGNSPDEVKFEIKSIQIKGTTINGNIVDSTSKITFDNVPAEQPIEALQFTVEPSPFFAKLDQEKYDFTKGASEDGKQLVTTIKLQVEEQEREYKVIINLLDPTSPPLLVSLYMRNSEGGGAIAATVPAVSNDSAKMDTICLNMEGVYSALIDSIVVYPSRATYDLTEDDQEGKISIDNPGQLVVEFMGLTTTYHISFAKGLMPGADLTSPIIHDFSVTKNVYPDFTTLTEGALNTRGSDFDGEHVLIVSRSDNATPTHHLLKVSDLLAGNINKIELSKEGVGNADTDHFVVSAGRLSHGHIYVCNLATALGDGHTLKVYHYADATATPDVWEWDGTGLVDLDGEEAFVVPRLGDNMSINLDENGNGYAFFCGQEASAERMYRVDVANFNEFSNPTEIILEEAFPYYGYVNQVDEDRYLLTSHYMLSTWLIDKNGNPLVDIYFQSTAAGLKPQTGVDPHVVKYNGGYYLIFASPYNNTKRLGVGPALYMIDITEGTQVDIQTALQNLSDILWEDEDGIWEPDYHYSLDVLDVEAEAHKTFTACTAQCNAAVVDGKLLVYAAAAGAGFAIIEFVPARSE